MRVVLFLDVFPKRTQPFLVAKFHLLIQAGVDVHVLCRRIDEEAWGSFAQLSSRPDLHERIHAIGRADSPRDAIAALRRLSGDVATSLRLLRAWGARDRLAAPRRTLADAWLVTLKPDVVHFEFAATAVGRLAFKDALGCAVTVSCRGYDVSYAGLDQPGYLDEVWAAADAVHCLGTDLWRRAQQRGCPADMPVAFIPPAVDADTFIPAPATVAAAQRTDGLRVLTVARLHWKKGHLDALRAVRHVLDAGTNAHYRIVGAGPGEEEVRTAVRLLHLEEHVTFLGHQSPFEVKEALTWADVFLLPSLSEGFSNAVLEAQAMTVPVVCTDADGLSENVIDGETGFIVPRRQPAVLAERLLRLGEDIALRKRMGAAGRARVTAKFTCEHQVEAFVRFYSEAAERARARGRRAALAPSTT